ncbi:MAG TPA: HD domain-containing phosphohydrolase [Actinomycetota bacterium]|nr:HD domain-containing phosphohydrolase [Actinomycetota bacterium]
MQPTEIRQPTQGPVPIDGELPALHAQLVVFAREIGSLYQAERARARELEQAHAGLREMVVATMTALAEVVEAKDVTTRGHLDRTYRYGLALAERIDPVLAALPEVGYGFFLHDIGKVGVPEAVLCKPGPLEDDEWAVMRRHPVIGAQIVAPMRFLHGAVEIVRTHHERWDGRGYPDGLRGEQIPLAARIFAIADSFDAMTSHRPYRAAMSHERALAEIVEGAGSQFDPDVARTFLQLVEEGGLPLDEPGLPTAGII